MTQDVPGAPRLSMDGERLLALMRQLVPVIGSALPPDSVVELHDLTGFPTTLVTSHGDGTSADLSEDQFAELLDAAEGAPIENATGHVRTVTTVIRDTGRSPVAALRLVSDVSRWQAARQAIDTFLRGADAGPLVRPVPATSRATSPARDDAPRHVGDLAARLIDEAIEEVGVPVDLMRKEHKTQVVQRLQTNGIFLLRDSVETVAASLQVTRFTVYNYLNEIDDAQQPGGTRDGGGSRPRKRA